ncbi:DUF6415 family natural product biosynthesis protein [Streptomyces sp. NPDC021100]|uniref:DUF6415 family natural product biosynthesis protein n=1 Tax=Streptomyces sp. NPDC021100 TaxID=3365114 RepID=UPI00378D2339
MAPLNADAMGQADVSAHVAMVLAWDLNGPDPPLGDVTLRAVEQLTAYRRIIAEDLNAQCRGIPADCGASLSAQAILGEASRRLHLPPPYRTPRAAGHRAQNIARLVDALLRAVEEVSAERARTPHHQHTTRKGIR